MDGFKRPRVQVPPRVDPQTGRPLGPYGQPQAVNTPVQPQQIERPQYVPQQSSTPTGQQIPSLPPVQMPGVQSPQQSRAPLSDLDLSESQVVQPPKKRHIARNIFLTLFVLGLIALAAGYVWYKDAIKPAKPNDSSATDFSVTDGDTVAQVAQNLQGRGLIKNAVAYQLFVRRHGLTSMQVQNCTLRPSQSVAEISNKLADPNGCQDFKAIMFYPGATIEKPLYKPEGAQIDQSTMYIKYRLKKAGYTDSEIGAALSKQYTGPLFADKPAGTSLEGYIYGDTYHVATTATADQVLQQTFNVMYKDISSNGLVEKYKAQNLNLYQAITLASIVQRELNCEGKVDANGQIDEARTQRCYGYLQSIAQVFLKRYHEGTMLGSDVTFIYAADMKGVTPTVDIDSPYNTRLHPGLPPGPIASPGLLALKAVGNPAPTDYNFFIAGDDGLIYFAKTAEEHEANIKNHCQILCNDL